MPSLFEVYGFKSDLLAEVFFPCSRPPMKMSDMRFATERLSAALWSNPNSIFIGGLEQGKKIVHKIKKLQSRKNFRTPSKLVIPAKAGI